MSNITVMYNFGKKLGLIAAVYMLGYFGLSFLWLIVLVVLSVTRDSWKKKSETRRSNAKALALRNERELLYAHMDALPSWVYFPDVERVEWLNLILRQLWPNINQYVCSFLKNSIEPGVRNSLAQFRILGFNFEKIILGDIPIRIGGVKVYDMDLHQKEIMLDMDLFYAGDCDISFSLGGLKGGIKDFQIRGILRVEMKPLITDMPLVGGFQVFFLNNPTVDFSLDGIVNILDMPGMSGLLRRAVVKMIAGLMVLPNKLPIQLCNSFIDEQLRMPKLEGVLRIHLVAARNLMKKDNIMLPMGKSYPYAVITVGKEKYRTKTVNNTVNPKWDFWCESIVHFALEQEVHVELFDAEDFFKDSRLGRVTVDVNTLISKRVADMWLTLDEAKHGMIHARFTWLTLTKEPSVLSSVLLETKELQATSLSTAVLMVYIHSAKNLPDNELSGKINPLVKLSLGHRQQLTPAKENTHCPVFEQGFTFLVGNPETDTLDICVINEKNGKSLGHFIYYLSELLEKDGLHAENQPFPLAHDDADAKIIMSMTLRILVPPVQTDTNDQPDVREREEIDDATVTPSNPSLGGSSGSLSRTHSPDLPIELTPNVELQEPSGETQVAEVMNVSTTVDDSKNSEIAPPDEGSISSAGNSGKHLQQINPSVSSTAGKAGLGRIQLTFRYSIQTQKFIVIVHKIVKLPLKDKDFPPDPYVKLCLRPDLTKNSKRKTETVKNNVNPVYDERFEYIMSQMDLNLSQLVVSVVTKKSWLSSRSPLIGQIILNLGELGLPNASTLWFDILPEG